VTPTRLVPPFEGPAHGDVSRREMLGALARWSVPTVLTLALAARPAAAASCPPCTRKSGGRCRSCTVNQILNCQCEPCLGAPYCAGAAALSQPQGALAQPPEGTSRPAPLFDLESNPLAPTSPFGLNPFTGRPYGAPRDSLLRSRGGLYDRLRTDQRRPF